MQWVCKECGNPFFGDSAPRGFCTVCFETRHKIVRAWAEATDVQPRKAVPEGTLGTPSNPRKQGLRSAAPFKRHYSPVHGRRLTSWSEYRKANKELGIICTGEPAPKDQYGTTRTVSAPGLKCR